VDSKKEDLLNGVSGKAYERELAILVPKICYLSQSYDWFLSRFEGELGEWTVISGKWILFY
jgi:hypothetical protein